MATFPEITKIDLNFLILKGNDVSYLHFRNLNIILNRLLLQTLHLIAAVLEIFRFFRNF